MPQFLALILIGGAAWYGYKLLKREMQRVANELDETEESNTMKEVEVLQRDEDGVYRPKKDG